MGANFRWEGILIRNDGKNQNADHRDRQDACGVCFANLPAAALDCCSGTAIWTVTEHDGQKVLRNGGKINMEMGNKAFGRDAEKDARGQRERNVLRFRES